MLSAITIERITGDGKYKDVLDALDVLSDRYGSAVNAANVLIRAHPEFPAALKVAKERQAVPAD